MQPEEHSWRTGQPPDGGSAWLNGGADSSNRPWETDSLRIAGGDPVARVGVLVACAAALLALADMALLSSAAGEHAFGDYGRLAEVPRWRLLLGHYLGILLLPAYVPGYWLVFRGLRQAGGWRSWPVFLIGSYSAIIAGAYHGLIALFALIVQLGITEPAAAGELLERARAFAEPLHGAIDALFVLASAWFAVAVLGGRTRFPRWLAAANPLVLALVLGAPNELVPGFTPARLAAPASFNLAHLVFFLLVTVALRRATALRPG